MTLSYQSLYDTLEFLQEMGVTDTLAPTAQSKRKMSVAPAPLPQKNATPLPAQSLKTASADGLRTQLQAITTLEDLKHLMENFTGCALKKSAMNTVFADGTPDAKVMLVGEAPGADEDRLGLPFVGLSGQLLDKMFQAIGYDRTTNLYISNILPWRPPGNRQPSPQEVAQCLPFIEKHIALINPDVVVCVGGTSVKALLENTQGITKLRGQFLTYQNSFMAKPCKAFAIFHPAYLLRSPGQKRFVWRDLLTLKDALQKGL